jgi:uncharacterized protein (DUF2336 family)
MLQTKHIRMIANVILLGEVDAAIRDGSRLRCSQIARRVTDLFLVNAEEYSEQQIGLFDAVLVRLAAEIETSARALLAARLSPNARAPLAVIRMLALDDEIDVARSVLSQSERLDNPTLLEIATTRGQAHLLAISERRVLDPALTDVLVTRGDHDVVLSAARNRGATFSANGFDMLAARSERDFSLSDCLSARPDLPPYLLSRLIASASALAREALERSLPQQTSGVQQAIADVTLQLHAEMVSGAHHSITARVNAILRTGPLDDKRVRALLDGGRLEDATLALAVLCSVPLEFVQRVMERHSPIFLLILAKAAELSWPTMKSAFSLRAGYRRMSGSEIDSWQRTYDRLTLFVAEKILRPHRTHNSTLQH